MYIKYKNINYPCQHSISTDDIVYRNLPNDFPTPVSGEIILCADDGFIMRTDIVEDYLRQIYEDGTLTLTNLPETVFDEESEDVEYTPSLEDRITALEYAVRKMESDTSESIAAIEDALCELDQ